MLIEETSLSGVLILTPRRFADSRGFFANWNMRTLRDAGVELPAFVQDNHSVPPGRDGARAAFPSAAARSGKAGALRARAPDGRGRRHSRG